MNSDETPSDIRQASTAALAAMHRAAIDAQKLADQTDTPLWTWENGAPVDKRRDPSKKQAYQAEVPEEPAIVKEAPED